MNEIQIMEQEICGEAATPWAGFKVNQIKNVHISIVHEVDEQSIASRSRTPCSVFKVSEMPNFDRQDSITPNKTQETPNATIIHLGEPCMSTEVSQVKTISGAPSPILKIKLPGSNTKRDLQENTLYNTSGSKALESKANQLAAQLNKNCVE